MADLIYRILNAIGYPHPLHPVLVHVTTGTVIAAFVFGFVAWIFRKPALYRTARHSTVLALISTFFTVFMGFMDWLHFFVGESSPTFTSKIVLSGTLLVLLVATVAVNRRVAVESKVPLIFYALSFVNVVALGIFGARLVY